MMTVDIKNLLTIAIEASRKAGEEILKVYQSDDFQVEAKGDDSPLTRADKAAHDRIVSFLDETGLPVLSEEGKGVAYQDRSKWEYFWMVDPLDGTKEFIKKNGEFTVNIALIRNGKSVAGVVYAPVLDKMYFSDSEKAYLEESSQVKEISASNKTLGDPDLKVVASRSHLNDDTRELIESLENPSTVSMGSSLKFMLVAEGKADIYPRFAPTMEWDTAAAQAIVESAGKKVTLADKKTPVRYNKEDLLNPYFIVH